MHPLDGAYERVNRAREHLADLKQRADTFCQNKRDSVVIQRKPATFRLADGREVKGVLGSATVPVSPLPPIIGILVGETVYNLRASLDYLVYELARFDAGKVIEMTQFPIEDTESGFKGKRNSYLKGISEKHVESIQKLQPCAGCRWTQRLREISNPDKHRHLVTGASPVIISPSSGSTEAIMSGQTANVKNDVVVQITFNDRTPVVETLEQLLSEVAKTLDTFKPEFK